MTTKNLGRHRCTSLSMTVDSSTIDPRRARDQEGVYIASMPGSPENYFLGGEGEGEDAQTHIFRRTPGTVDRQSLAAPNPNMPAMLREANRRNRRAYGS